jgi:phage recombination protein Bet
MSQVIKLNHSAENGAVHFTEEQIEIIKNVVAPGLTQQEFEMFLYICMRHKLDPIARQIYAIKRKNQMTIQTSIDGFRLIAERTGKYAPGRPTEFTHDDKGALISATAYVKKLVGTTWHEVAAIAYLREYFGTSPLWAKMPHVMLEKCAEARALRRAFPGDLSGLYSEDEMDQSQKSEANSEKKEEEPKEYIPLDKVQEIEEYFKALPNGEDLKKRMLQFCDVSTVADLEPKQMKACANFIRAHKEKIK